MKRERQIISREHLYELVWSKPITSIAKELGVSDSAVIKACKRMRVPRPGRGYWTKVEANAKLPVKPKLPVWKSLPNMSAQWVVQDQDKSARAKPKATVEHIPFPVGKVDFHPITIATRNGLTRGKLDSRNCKVSSNKRVWDICVSEQQVERACVFMDALVNTAKEAGYRVQVVIDPELKTIVLVKGERVEIKLEEKIRQIRKEKSAEEKKALGYFSWAPVRFEYHPTAELRLTIQNAPTAPRRVWADGKIQRLENCLGSILIGFENAAGSIQKARLDRERWEREWAARQRQYELERQRAWIESQKQEKLFNDINHWEQAQKIREYSRAMQVHLAANPNLASWIDWVNGYANSVDPLLNPGQLAYYD